MNEPTTFTAVHEIDYFGPVPGMDYGPLPDEPRIDAERRVAELEAMLSELGHGADSAG